MKSDIVEVECGWGGRWKFGQYLYCYIDRILANPRTRSFNGFPTRGGVGRVWSS